MIRYPLTIFGVVLGTGILLASSQSQAFTSESGGDTGLGAGSESGSSSATGGYDYSDPHFNFSVRKNQGMPDNGTTRANAAAEPRTSAPEHESRGFFGRVWNGLLDLVGSGD